MRRRDTKTSKVGVKKLRCGGCGGVGVRAAVHRPHMREPKMQRTLLLDQGND